MFICCLCAYIWPKNEGEKIGIKLPYCEHVNVCANDMTVSHFESNLNMYYGKITRRQWKREYLLHQSSIALFLLELYPDGLEWKWLPIWQRGVECSYINTLVKLFWPLSPSPLHTHLLYTVQKSQFNFLPHCFYPHRHHRERWSIPCTPPSLSRLISP